MCGNGIEHQMTVQLQNRVSKGGSIKGLRKTKACAVDSFIFITKFVMIEDNGQLYEDSKNRTNRAQLAILTESHD